MGMQSFFYFPWRKCTFVWSDVACSFNAGWFNLAKKRFKRRLGRVTERVDWRYWKEFGKVVKQDQHEWSCGWIPWLRNAWTWERNAEMSLVPRRKRIWSMFNRPIIRRLRIACISIGYIWGVVERWIKYWTRQTNRVAPCKQCCIYIQYVYIYT